MRFVFLVLAFFSTFFVFSQENLNVANIPDSLKENADAILRYSNVSYEIKENKLIKQKSFAITLMNDNAKENAYLIIPYDSYTNIKKIEGYIYNANGIKTEKLSKENIKDYAAYPSFTLFSDNRIKVVGFSGKNYPVTIEYIYELESKGLLMPESWVPINDYRRSLEKAQLQIIVPDSIIQYKYQNIRPTFTKETVNNNIIYSWKINGIKAKESEPFSLPFQLIMPKIFVNASKTKYFEYPVEFNDWKSYGKMVFNFLTGREIVPTKSVEEINSLCKNANTELEKVKIVYAYVQNKVRYVNVTKGIGGFQPLPAAEVDKYGYGDCKALSNYTRALLNAVGIKSYYAEIGNGNNKRIQFPDFASVDQTNHVILFVPLKSDSLWLECTSNTIPFGYIGSGNCNRQALVVTEEGGKLIDTPSYNEFDNLLSISGEIFVEETGNAHLKIKKTYSNELFDEVMPFLSLSKQETEKYINKSIPINGFHLTGYSFINKSSYKNIKGELAFEGDILQYAELMGKRIALKPNIISRSYFGLNKKRNNNVYFSQSFTQTDTIAIHVPSGYKLEFEYPEISFSCPAGYYSTKISQKKADSFLMIRKLTIKKGIYGKENYPEIYDFFKNSALADNKSCIFTKL